ncbi:MAG: hypothetical protein CMF45_04860 [Legionellales bacterium]|nr:hypothetical protein [Legionellales bacterium]
MSEETDQNKEPNKEPKLDPDLQKTLDADQQVKRFLAGEEFVNSMLGIELKPVTLATLAMMQEAGCELISGQNIENVENLMMEVLLFVYIHTEKPDTVARLLTSGDNPKQILRRNALNTGMGISPKQIPELVEQIITILGESTGTKVEPLPDEDEMVGVKKNQEKE